MGRMQGEMKVNIPSRKLSIYGKVFNKPDSFEVVF